MQRLSVARNKQRRSKKRAVPLKQGLEKHLLTCALVAGASMTLTSAARAEIVYTSVFRSVRVNAGEEAIIAIDLNNDGIIDFNAFVYLTNSGGPGRTGVYPLVNSNKIIGTPFYNGNILAGAAALKSGAYIGPGEKFFAGANVMATSYECHQVGPWGHVVGRYLGLEFRKDGETHFGWARLNAGGCGVSLTGYAYETIPGKPITAGQTQSGDDVGTLVPQVLAPQGSATFQPATLGLLAQGASGLVAWRREDGLLSADV